MPKPHEAPKFCGQPGWPPCSDPPQPAAKLGGPSAIDQQSWKSYMAGRSDEQNGVPLGPIPPWFNGAAT